MEGGVNGVAQGVFGRIGVKVDQAEAGKEGRETDEI